MDGGSDGGSVGLDSGSSGPEQDEDPDTDPPASDPPSAPITMESTGISERTIDFINNLEYKDLILKEKGFLNTLRGIIEERDSVPARGKRNSTKFTSHHPLGNASATWSQGSGSGSRRFCCWGCWRGSSCSSWEPKAHLSPKHS